MSSDEGDASGGIDPTIAAWRQRGDHRVDPVRFRFIEALARRAAGHEGAARRLLDEKLRNHVAAYGEALRKSREAGAPMAPDTAAPAREPGALAGLVALLGQHASAPPPSTARGAAPAPAPAPSGELKTLRYFKSTWSRLSADRRLTQSRAKVPENAGPLNSHHLVHRALTLMHELSPEYLNRFMAHVDGLLWLDDMNARPPASGAPGADMARKSGRAKSR